MKKKILSVSLALLLCAAPFVGGAIPAFTASAAVAESMSVTGNATVEAEPDSVIFSGRLFAVSEEDADALLKEKLEKVTEAFSAYGEVREAPFHAHCPMPHGASPRKKEGHTKAGCALLFSSDKPEQFKEMCEALKEAGVRGIECVQFLLKNDGQARREALKAAFEDAKQNAAALGAEGEATKAEELWCSVYAQGDKIVVNASVRVTY